MNRRASFLMLTIDRYDITSKVWDHNIKSAVTGLPEDIHIESLVCDNGSKDRRIVNFFDGKADHHRVNARNEGCSKAFNQLFLRSKGDYICLLGNDIEMPNGWLAEAIKYIEGVPNCGIVGFDWGHGGVPPVSMKFGSLAHWLTPQLNRVFGAWVFHRRIVDEIGFFHEGFGPYGLEDSDFNERVNLAGFNSLYHPTLKSKHLVSDVGENSEYRKMKDNSMGHNLTIFMNRADKFHDTGVREPLPALRDPL